MHELALARAALPAPTVCLGMLLKPYSIGHELWLIRENNSVLRGVSDSLAVQKHLSAAVLICCQSWIQLKTMRQDPLLGIKMRIWKFRIWKSGIRKRHLKSEVEKFIAYRNEGLLEFKLSQVDRGKPAPRMPGAPFILRLQQWLMTQFRITEAEAWDYPVGLAKMRWATHWESESGLEVWNAHDAEDADFIAYWEARGGPAAMRRQDLATTGPQPSTQTPLN